MKSLAVLAVAAIALVACHSDRGYPPGPSLLIEDGNHGGNAFFYWLAPLVKQEAPASQVFSAQISPAITIAITNLCTNSVIRTFAGADVQIDDGAAYHANWRTADDMLDESCTYRLTVSAGSERLGVADIDVVDNGRELKNVNTDEYIPLLDDRTLPIKFFVGVGSLCDAGASDCGEGVAQPGVNTTIVTTSGRAGVFIPGDAVTEDATITIQSIDNQSDGLCIPGLLQQYAGTPGVDNSCYDFRGKPSAIDQTGPFRFSNNVTVGICPPINALQGPHAVLDLLQIFQFDDFGGGNTLTQPLRNVQAPFLRCDPQFSSSIGSRGSLLGDIARVLGRIVGPRPLYASTRTAMFDLGAGGSTEMFSRFTWALPSTGLIDFDMTPDLTAISPGAVVNDAYSRIGVMFSRTSGIGICQGTAVYANSIGGSNTISLCPQGVLPAFSALSGAIVASFTVPVTRVCVDATPIVTSLPLLGGLPNGAFLEALGTDGALLVRSTVPAIQQTQSICIDRTGIAAVRFAGAGGIVARFDNLSFSRILNP
jgi:hypothetical protein